MTFFPGDEDATKFDWHHGGYPTRAWLEDALRAVGFSRAEVVYTPSFRWPKKLAALLTNMPQRGRMSCPCRQAGELRDTEILGTRRLPR